MLKIPVNGCKGEIEPLECASAPAREVQKAAVVRRLPSMSAMTIFYQQCPVCGRNLRIPAKYFGRQMTCTHCKGEFRAGKDELPEAPAADAQVSAGLLTPGVFSQPQLGEV